MGLSFSRSVKFGPVRFNFSGSGIGMSTGIKGLRIGTGPRGAYISAGVGGFRYRTSLGGARKAAPAARAVPSATPEPGNYVPDANVIATVTHDTQSVLALTDSSGDVLLQSINEQAAKPQLWPFVAAGFAILLFLGVLPRETWLAWVKWVFFVGFLCLTMWVRHRDQMKRLTVLFFEPDDRTTQAFSAVVEAAESAVRASKLRSVLETSTYADSKYTAGAGQGLRLGPSSSAVGQAPSILANVAVPVLKGGSTTLAFYPDRVLAFQGKNVGAISYDELEIKSFPSKYVENESVPSDATVVEHTWQYVNKGGGPDKRFKNNRQLPVCRYNRLHISTKRGLDIRLLGSRDGGFDSFAEAVARFARAR